MTEEPYEQPVVTDYGTLTELTEAVSVIGNEDGASKIDQDNHHSAPLIP